MGVTSDDDGVEYRSLKPPRETKNGSRNQQFEKSKVASNELCTFS